jgi:peptidoglycan-N-acetylglucosamine deacetylase
MAEKQIFYDPQRKRWKRLRRILDAVAVVTTLVVAGFVFNSLRGQPIPELLLPKPRHNFKALDYRSYRGAHDRTPLLKNPRQAAPGRRKTQRKPSQIPLNTGEGLRAAFYVPYDAASYSSFKEHVHQIDMLFPDWMHVDAPEPELLSMSSENTLQEYKVIDHGVVRDPDELNKIKHVIQDTRVDTEIFPHLNNFNPHTQTWDPAVGNMLADDGKRAALEEQIMSFFAALPVYRGLSLDFENLGGNSVDNYMTFVAELYTQLHARDLRLYVNTPVSLQDKYLKQLGANTDGVILMDYDQHEVESDPGPIAAQSWFVANLQRVLKIVPREKIICAIGNYGYDWTMSMPEPPKDRHGRPRGKAPKPQVVDTEDLSVSDVW